MQLNLETKTLKELFTENGALQIGAKQSHFCAFARIPLTTHLGVGVQESGFFDSGVSG